jgi:hypothetical protein
MGRRSKNFFPPRLCFNRSENGTVRLFAHPGLAGLEIVHREVDMVKRMGLSALLGR